MKKAIGSLPVWQFTLLLVAVLAVFTVAVNVYSKRQKTA
jgi:hypothetical protein